VFVRPADSLDDQHLDWGEFTAQEKQEALHSRWSLGIAGTLGEDIVADFHLQLRVMAVVAPTVVAMFDEGSFRVHSGGFVRDAAASQVPPSYETLFSVHVVAPEAESEDRGCWLHTHGLLRCGCIELEALGVKDGQVDTVAEFMSKVGARFLDVGVPACDEPFHVGDDLELIWLPWQRGLEMYSDRLVGGSPDRDENHSTPAAMLFVPTRGVRRRRYLGMGACVPALEKNPVYFVSDAETERQRDRAQEKLDAFLRLQREFATAQDWSFSVKLGFEGDSDAATGRPTHEHLWFDLHGVQGQTIEATLLNEPFYMRELKTGERGRFSLRRLTDWTVYSPHGTFSPDRLYHLLRLLGDGTRAPS
jgi:hypothetical protein